MNWKQAFDSFERRGLPGLSGVGRVVLQETVGPRDGWERRVILVGAAVSVGALERAESELNRWLEAGLLSTDERNAYVLLQTELIWKRLERSHSALQVTELRRLSFRLPTTPKEAQKPDLQPAMPSSISQARALALLDADSLSDESALRIGSQIRAQWSNELVIEAYANAERDMRVLGRSGIRCVTLAIRSQAADIEIGERMFQVASDTHCDVDAVFLITQDKGFGDAVQRCTQSGIQTNIVLPRADASAEHVARHYYSQGARRVLQFSQGRLSDV